MKKIYQFFAVKSNGSEGGTELYERNLHILFNKYYKMNEVYINEPSEFEKDIAEDKKLEYKFVNYTKTKKGESLCDYINKNFLKEKNSILIIHNEIFQFSELNKKICENNRVIFVDHLFGIYLFNKKIDKKLSNLIFGKKGWLNKKQILNNIEKVKNSFANKVEIVTFVDNSKNQTAKSIFKKVHYIPLATDKVNNIKHTNFKEKKYDFCYIGRLHPIKNIGKIVNFVNKTNSSLIVAGSGKEVSKIKDKNIKYVGHADKKLKMKIYSESKFAINFSVFEGQCYSLIESMSYGIPSFILNIHFPASEYLTKNNSGINSTSLRKLTKTWKKIRFDEKNYKTLSDNTLSLHNKFLTTEVWKNNWVNLINNNLISLNNEK